MESIWGLLEAFIEGFSNAGSVRLALHLGKGNIVQAKRSAWKSLFLVTALGLVISVIYAIIGDHIAVLFTSDETLQNMLKAMIPIICFGNVFQSFGSMAWCLVSEMCVLFHISKIFGIVHFMMSNNMESKVGSQGRYHHATLISTTVTITVSVPLAAFFSLGMHFSLESLVAAMVIGYSTISMCLSYLLITSDWSYISKKVIEENEDSDSSDDSSSSSSASSASSNELCDNAVDDFQELALEPQNAISEIFASSSIASSSSNDDRGDFSVSSDSEQVPHSSNMQRENMSSSGLSPTLFSSSSSSYTPSNDADCRAQTTEDEENIRSLEVDAIYPPSKEYSATPSPSNSDCKNSGATRTIPAISEVADEKEEPCGLPSSIITSSNSDLPSSLFSVAVLNEDKAGKAEISNSSELFVLNSRQAEGIDDLKSSLRSLGEEYGDDKEDKFGGSNFSAELRMNGVNNDVNNKDAEEIEKINSSSISMADGGDEEETDTNFYSFSHDLSDHITDETCTPSAPDAEVDQFGNPTIFLP